LLGAFDHAMLLTADESGRVSDGLNHVSELRIKQFQRVDSLNASLILPKGIVMIGAFAGVFVRITAGGQSISQAMLAIGIASVWFFLVCHFLLFLIRSDSRIWMAWLWPHKTLLKRSKWCCLALEHFFYKSLVWQISAGVTYNRAIERCSKLLSSPIFQNSVDAASRDIAAGTSLTESLLQHDLVITDRMRQVLSIADQSGTHERAIKHELKLQDFQLRLYAENFFKWMPRLFYLLALVVVSSLMKY